MDEIIPDDARESILREITPTAEELKRQQHIISALTEALAIYSEEKGHRYSFIEAQGSTGRKQTQLKGAGDIDLFVALHPKEHERTLSLPVKERNEALDEKLDSIIDEWFIPAFKDVEASNVLKTYSQHPYLSLEVLGTDVDVLVCFDLSKDELMVNGPVTAVDRTVHHTRFVAEKLDTHLREDTRILKSFVRACHTYGDVCFVGQMGFTGYSLELLVILQKGLRNALIALKDLHQNPIDIKDRTLDTLQNMPPFRNNHIFIIDPTDTNRNVASSFSKRAYDWLRMRTIDFLNVRDGGVDDYRNLVIEKPIPTDQLPSWLALKSFAYTFRSDGLHHYTILRDKLHRFARKLVSRLQNERTGEVRFGDVLYEIFFEGNRFALGLVVEKTTTSATYTRRGPPIDIVGSKRFSETHKDAFELEGYLWVEEKRKWTSAKDMIEDMIDRHNVEGLVLEKDSTELDAKVQNVIYRYVLPVEPEFPIKGTV